MLQGCPSRDGMRPIRSFMVVLLSFAPGNEHHYFLGQSLVGQIVQGVNAPQLNQQTWTACRHDPEKRSFSITCDGRLPDQCRGRASIRLQASPAGERLMLAHHLTCLLIWPVSFHYRAGRMAWIGQSFGFWSVSRRFQNFLRGHGCLACCEASNGSNGLAA